MYLERWDRIDYKRVKFLLMDPRYPNLPSYSTCVPTFEQPSNWGDFFGSRLRTYFVPLETGNHYFYICKPCLIMNGFISVKNLLSLTKKFKNSRFGENTAAFVYSWFHVTSLPQCFFIGFNTQLRFGGNFSYQLTNFALFSDLKWQSR